MKKNGLSALALGIMAGMIGFSFALATSHADPLTEDGGARASTVPLGVGSGLRISNPFITPGQEASFPSGGAVGTDPQGFDLGDACFGSALVRYITALDGVKPYSFTPPAPGPAGLNLGTAGRLFGMVPVAAGSSTLFNATLTDAAGKTRVGRFRLGTFLCPIGTFRFAHNRLSDARVGQDYITNIEVLGGAITTKFSVVPGSVVFNGSAVTDMESMGIRLFEDGTIAGRPIKSGTLNFIARAQSTTGAIARNRTNTAPDQPLSISIAAVDNIESVLGTVASTISGSTKRPGRDIFSYNAVVNTNGLSPRDLANLPVTLRLGGKTFSTTLDFRGQARVGDLRVAMTGPNKSLRISLRNQNFSTLFGTLPDQSKKVVVVEVQIGDKFLGTEPLYYSVVNRNGRYRLIYGLYRSRQIGGLFQILSVLGDDGFGGTAFRTKFLISQVPDSSNEFFGNPSGATINIGPGFSQSVPLFRGRGFFPPPGIAAVQLQPSRRIGQIQTYHLPSSQTGVAQSKDSGGNPQTLLLGMQVTTDTLLFKGAASQKIFPFFQH